MLLAIRNWNAYGYALAGRTARAAQVKFLQTLASVANALDAVTIEYNPGAGDEPERDKIHDVRSKMALAFYRCALVYMQ